jgi:hypothetical protein
MIAPLYHDHEMGYMPGLSGMGASGPLYLGAISDAVYAEAENDGIPTSTLDQLNALGASDAQIEQVINGTLDPQVLANELAQGQGSVAPVVATPASPYAGTPILSPGVQPVTQPAGSTLQVQPGSTLLYTASWPTLSPSFTTAAAAIADIQNDAASHNLSIIASTNTSSTASLTSSIQVTVKANTGFGLATDVKSILDGILYAQIGNMPASDINPISSPNTGGVVAAPTTSVTSWLESNGTLVIIGLGALGLIVALKK